MDSEEKIRVCVESKKEYKVPKPVVGPFWKSQLFAELRKYKSYSFVEHSYSKSLSTIAGISTFKEVETLPLFSRNPNSIHQLILWYR